MHILLLLVLGVVPFEGMAVDLILHNGRIAAVDEAFSIHQAIAIEDGRVLAVGSDREILELRKRDTEVLDLAGKLVLPGLIDSHVHSASACMVEFDHPIPPMENIPQVLGYIRERAKVVPKGEWIVLRQVFITRLAEQRYPTRAELDEAAPEHPVLFATGPDASLNTLALKRSGIDRNFEVTDGGSGFAEKDPVTGEPTGILRNCTRYVKARTSARPVTAADRERQLKALFADYNAAGITAVCDRNAGTDAIALYMELLAQESLTVRVHLSHSMNSIGPLDEVQANIRKVAEHPLFKSPGDLLRIIGIKAFLDGGMLTGSAFMREPWGVSEIYSIDDPDYCGVLFIPQERLVPMVRTAVELGLQFTAHAVGDGAVHALLNAYETVSQEMPIRETRPCISHSNFMSREAVVKAARLGVVMDIQPAWLYLDAHTLLAQFGYERMRYFQPLRTILEEGGTVGGGSDHMQKIGPMRSVNPYNPFLGMATAITRKGKHLERPLHPEEALTREQAIRFYTANNAKVLGREEDLGSLTAGKIADLIVVDRDLLTCPEEQIASTQVLRTYLAGELVHDGLKGTPKAQ